MSAIRMQRITTALAVLDAIPALPEGERLQRFLAEAEGQCSYTAGTYVLRAAGVTTTQTSGRAGLLAKWQDAARRSLQKMKAVQG